MKINRISSAINDQEISKKTENNISGLFENENQNLQKLCDEYFLSYGNEVLKNQQYKKSLEYSTELSLYLVSILNNKDKLIKEQRNYIGLVESDCLFYSKKYEEKICEIERGYKKFMYFVICSGLLCFLCLIIKFLLKIA